MSLPIAFRTAARFEFDQTSGWYVARRPGLGESFITAVQVGLSQIAIQPNFYVIAEGDIQEASVHGFPYCVYYREEPGRIVVLAVFHTSRDPAIWRART